MELSNLSMHALVVELQSIITDARVSKIQAIAENGFKFKLSTRQGTRELIVLPHSFFLTQFKIPTTEHSQSFVQSLRKHVEGKKISCVFQKGFDRVVVFEFEAVSLVLELFASGNLVLVGADQKIIACLHRETWKDRTIQRGFEYRFPESKQTVTEISVETFSQICAKSAKKIVPVLVTEFNVFPALAEEAVLSNSISLDASASTLSGAQLKKIFKTLQRFSLAKKKPGLVQTKTGFQLLAFELPHWTRHHDFSFQPISSVSETLDGFWSPTLTKTQSEPINALQDKQLAKLAFSIAQQKKAIQKFETEALENQQRAEWIFSHYAELQELQKALAKASQNNISSEKALRLLQASRIAGIEITRQLIGLDKTKRKATFEI